MKRALLYTRVSTLEQANEGISLEGQEVELRAYCAAVGLEVVGVITDAGVSGAKPLGDRAGGRVLLDTVAAGDAEAVVAFKLDRLFRSTSNALTVTEAWHKKGVSLHLKDMGGQAIDTSSAVGRMFLTMLAAFATFERDQCSERIRSALALKKSKNEYLGGRVPYGFRLVPEGLLEPEPVEQEAIALAKDWHSVGQSLRKIGASLLERGHRPRSSSTWGPSSVRAILKVAT
jgi:site-specific DNA recombinase